MRAWGESSFAEDREAQNENRRRRRVDVDGGGYKRARVVPEGHPPAWIPGMPPAYDGSGKGTFSTYDMYFGKGMAPPAYDGVPSKNKGKSSYEHYMPGWPPAYPAMLPPPFYGMPPMPSPWMMGKGAAAVSPMPPPAWALGRGDAKKGKGVDGKGNRKGDKPRDKPVSTSSLDAELDAYFKGPKSASTDEKKSGGGGGGGNNKEPTDAKSLDEALEKYMSAKDDDDATGAEADKKETAADTSDAKASAPQAATEPVGDQADEKKDESAGTKEKE